MNDMAPPGGGGQLYLQALQDVVRALNGIYGPLNTFVTSQPWLVPQGGTGRTSLTAHAVLLGEGASQIAFAAPAGAGRLLIDQGAAADPAFTAMSTDATIAANGALTIANNAIVTVKITDANVTYAKIQNISATQRVLGRNTAGAGVTEEVTFTQFLDWVGSAANGDILYRTGGAWARLPIGTNTNVLTVASSLPSWAAPAASGAKQADQQSFTGSGTWNKPSGFGAKAYALIECWGGGGGGGRSSAGVANTGGGGGGYNIRYVLLSSLGSTETVTIGAAGAAGASNGNPGGAGGNTTFGTWLTGYGGGGGGAASGFGAGGQPRVQGVTNTAILTPIAWINGAIGLGLATNNVNGWSGGYGGGGASIGCPCPAVYDILGGDSVMGGGGGGGKNAGGTARAAGSSFGGGAGGAAGSAGTQPGGGGGGNANAAAGAGAAGKCVVTVFDGA